jgi:hypothetical protein
MLRPWGCEPSVLFTTGLCCQLKPNWPLIVACANAAPEVAKLATAANADKNKIMFLAKKPSFRPAEATKLNEKIRR